MRMMMGTIGMAAALAVTGAWGMDMEHMDHGDHEAVTAESSAQTIHAAGTLKSISPDHMTVRIFHDPIPELKWPAMSMEFAVGNHELVHPLHPGDRVTFEFIQKEGKNVITKIAR